MEEAATNKRSASFWFFAVATAGLFLCSSFVLGHSFMSGERLAKKALKQGQRVFVTFDNGAVEGTQYKEKPPEVIPPQTTSTMPKNPKPPQNPPSTKPGDAQASLPNLNTSQPPSVSDTIQDTVEPDLPSPKGSIPMPQIGRGTASLAIAPFMAMSETVGEYTLPRIAPETKETPWQHYGKDIGETKRPMVAVIVTGLGQSRRLTDQALSLPPLFTLSFSPYGKDSPLWMINARNKGFESWLDMPAEPSDYPASDPGPNAILNDKGDLDNMNNLHAVMSRFLGYSGIVMPPGESITPNDALMMQLSRETTTRGVQLTYLPSDANQTFAKESKAANQLVIPADATVDEVLAKPEILNRLQALVAKAKKDGHAVGMLRAYPVSLETLKEWTASLKDSGVDLVPLTAIAKKIQ